MVLLQVVLVNSHWLLGAGEMKGIREAQQDLAGAVSENIWVICTSRGGIVLPHSQQLNEEALTGGITRFLGSYINLKYRHQMIKTHCFVQLGSKHSLLEKLRFWRQLPEHGAKIDSFSFYFSRQHMIAF